MTGDGDSGNGADLRAENARLVESLAHQLAGGQQDTWRIRCQRFQPGQGGHPLLFRGPALQRDQVQDPPAQGRLDRREMLGALGQNQDLPALPVGVDDFLGNPGRSGVINRQRPEDLLYAGVGRHDDCRGQDARRHLQRVRRTVRLRGRMPNRPALHEDDGLLPVAPYGCGCQAKHVLGLGPHQDRLEREGRQVVALVDDDLSVVLDQGIDLALALTPPGKGLHHRHVDPAGRSGLAAADGGAGTQGASQSRPARHPATVGRVRDGRYRSRFC